MAAQWCGCYQRLLCSKQVVDSNPGLESFSTEFIPVDAWFHLTNMTVDLFGLFNSSLSMTVFMFWFFPVSRCCLVIACRPVQGVTRLINCRRWAPAPLQCCRDKWVKTNEECSNSCSWVKRSVELIFSAAEAHS